MNKVSTNRSGFAAIEIILAFLLIVIVGAAGIFVFQHNRTKPTSAATTGTSTAPKNTGTSTPGSSAGQTDTTDLSIPELGITITLPSSLNDLTYQANTTTLANGNKATYALLTTKSLTGADPSCGANSGALGSLETASGQYPTGDQYAAVDYGSLLKQFPTFYVTYGSPQGGCSSQNEVLTEQSADKSAIQKALSSVRAN